MNKIAGLMTVLLLATAVGCSSSDKSTAEPESKTTQVEVKETAKPKSEETKENTKSLDGLVSAFKDAGMTIGDNETVAFDMVGAKDGRKFKLNGQLIEIYEYDQKSLSADGEKMFRDATENGSLNISGFNVPAVTNGSFMILRSEDHPDKDKILDIFKKF